MDFETAAISDSSPACLDDDSTVLTTVPQYSTDSRQFVD